MSVVEAVQRDLLGVGAGLSGSTLAATALALAAELDDPDNSATSKSMCAKALNETMATLRSLAPPRRDSDAIDDIAAQRERRRAAAGRAAPSDLPRT